MPSFFVVWIFLSHHNMQKKKRHKFEKLFLRLWSEHSVLLEQLPAILVLSMNLLDKFYVSTWSDERGPVHSFLFFFGPLNCCQTKFRLFLHARLWFPSLADPETGLVCSRNALDRTNFTSAWEQKYGYIFNIGFLHFHTWNEKKHAACLRILRLANSVNELVAGIVCSPPLFSTRERCWSSFEMRQMNSSTHTNVDLTLFVMIVSLDLLKWWYDFLRNWYFGSNAAQLS